MEKQSLVISIDGASRGNHSVELASRASYGVYFGQVSPHNRCGCLGDDLPQTSNRAEIEAAVQAIEIVAKLDVTGQRTTKVVLKTDSDYLNKSMTEWIGKWLTNGGLNSKGEEVKHWATLLALHERIIEVEKTKRLRILFWWVPREYNKEADALANLALDREDSAYGSN